MTDSLAQIGVTGLAVMGSNIARNFAHHGYTVAVHNRSTAKTDALIAKHGSEGKFIPAKTFTEFAATLERPRKALIMVQAGSATDAVIEELASVFEPGDIIIDGGNSLYTDTIRREADLAKRGFHFIGTGISGGEEGALVGPSIMPGGPAESYTYVGPILESISAHVDGVPCCTHIGSNGSGHFVKMVHNGIEYADMQLIAEAYQLLRDIAGVSPKEQVPVFHQWNTGELSSYLIEITAEVLAQEDKNTGLPLVDIIVDQAGQKGTGRWTGKAALDFGIPATGIVEAVFARALSSSVSTREVGQKLPSGVITGVSHSGREQFIDDVRQALYASKIVAYAQGFDLIKAGSTEYNWDIKPGDLATIWRGGCIIRAQFLDRIRQAYEDNPQLPSLLAAKYFTTVVTDSVNAWRRVIIAATGAGVPIPAFSSSLAYYDSLRTSRLPTALIQGLRDFFGAHTYKRIDKPGTFHTLWSGDRSEVETN